MRSNSRMSTDRTARPKDQDAHLRRTMPGIWTDSEIRNHGIVGWTRIGLSGKILPCLCAEFGKH